MLYILYIQSLSGGGFEGQWEQCATPGLAPIPLDHLAWGLSWDLHVHPMHGNRYHPPNQLQNILICTFHTKRFPTYTYRHIQTHTDTYRHIQTHIYVDTDTYMQYRHDTYMYSQPEPEPSTGNSVYTSSSSCIKLAWNAMYQVTHGATATASEWPGPFPNLNLENVY
jgi:hypothetical protein